MTDTPEATSHTADGERPSKRRHRLKIALLAAALAMVLVALSLVGARVLGWWPEDGEPVAEPTSSPTPTEPPSPFAGTPAEDFAEGEAGIVLPEAEPVGDFTAEEVADALEQVRRALIAARLDHTMLIDHDPDEFLALLAPDHQAVRHAAFRSGEFGAYATQVADDAVLAAVPPRVDGRISYGTVTVEGGFRTLELVTAFTWVYPFEASGSGPSGIVAVRDELVWEVRDERWLESSRGLWLASAGVGVWGADCDTHDEGLLKPAEAAAADLGDANQIFDLEQPVESSGSC